jgi:3-oxoacyl-[acyl-carrier protein] reductase
MESLHGQVAVVTGAARGVGLGIATVLREEGADVVLADRDERGARLAATQLSSSGEHAIGLGVDVTAQSDMARMAAEAVGRFGRIDILAANAGIYPHIPLADLRVADLEEMMAINVRGALLAIQACLPQRFRLGSSQNRKMSAGPCAFLPQRKRGT